MMEQRLESPTDDHHKLVSRIKVLADLKISERRLPQDGKFSYHSPNHNRLIDMRVASIPTKYGGKITLRLIGALKLPNNYQALGFSEESTVIIDGSLNMTQGLTLVTGPTSSGKSTTLYTFLKKIKERDHLSIISLEDPVEYELPGITQVSIDHQKTSFKLALRSALRHDPDVILVGEIRDADTASIAVRAALTGHLVLSTLHTNSASTVPQRLIDMGVAPYLVATTLKLIISQRLVKKLCPHCISSEFESSFGISYKNKGCHYCKGSGYKGRSGVYEFIQIDNGLREIISNQLSEQVINTYQKKRGVNSIWKDAQIKVNLALIDYETTQQMVGIVDNC
ncbi:MAG: type II secretory ATPase GspE/PulE/Tfp pilus assembly ATPase PilB-like protein [Cryomorphaceae bacterium]|jgi:type II secretory ATPase GspE/PulE/Tfp pilus assembly ATPase PilB-like protein